MGVLNVPGITQGWLLAALSIATTPLRMLLDSLFLRVYGIRGVTRTIYVRATGDDATADGTLAKPYREIRTALASVTNDGPVIRGFVVIDVGAGTYKGGIKMPAMRGFAMDDFIKIIGPNISHPTVPTVIIDKAADPTQTFGIQSFDGAFLWLEDIKFVGGFENHADIRRNTYLVWRNVHMDGQVLGVNGLSIQQHSRYTVLGGIIENMVDLGVSEHFGVHRSYDGATATDQQLIVRNCNTGIQAKECCIGHLDYVTVTDCLTGIELNAFGVSNLKGVTLMRNQLGIANINSETHNAQSINWGTGADANTEDYKPFGRAATDLTESGWVDGSTARSAQAGYPAHITVAASQSDSTKTGPLTETNFYNFTGAIKPRRYTVRGRSFKVTANGKIGATNLVAPYEITLRVAGTFAGKLTIPAGTLAGTRFAMEFEVACSTGGNNQKVFGTMFGGIQLSTLSLTNLVLDNVEAGVAVTAKATNAADEVTLHRCQVWA